MVLVHKIKKSPTLLPRVLQAIADLREVKGSAIKNIVGRIRETTNSPQIARVVQVRQALKRGLALGLFTHQAGRYRITPSLEGVVSLRGRRRSRSRRRRRKRRSRSGSRSRSRRRRRRSGRRRKRRRSSSSSRRFNSASSHGSEGSIEENKNKTVELEHEHEPEQDIGQKPYDHAVSDRKHTTKLVRKSRKLPRPKIKNRRDDDGVDVFPKKPENRQNRPSLKRPVPARPRNLGERVDLPLNHDSQSSFENDSKDDDRSYHRF